MTPTCKEAVQMALDAGAALFSKGGNYYGCSELTIERIASEAYALGVAHEREACVEMLERNKDYSLPTRISLANAIRNRSNT